MIAFVYIPWGEQFTQFMNSLGILPWTSMYKPGVVDLGQIFVTPVVVTQVKLLKWDWSSSLVKYKTLRL